LEAKNFGFLVHILTKRNLHKYWSVVEDYYRIVEVQVNKAVKNKILIDQIDDDMFFIFETIGNNRKYTQ
jgi:hypothetical protein